MRNRLSFLLILMLILALTMQCAKEASQTDIQEKNKEMVRNWFEEGWNKHNLEVINEYFADNFFSHSLNTNRDGFKQFCSNALMSLPDIHFTIDDQVAEGDKVVTRWTYTATHKGEWLGIPATGKQILQTGVNISRHVHGKYVEDWGISDRFGLKEQLLGTEQ